MNGIQAYAETSVSTQTRGRLIVLLYDGAIRFLRKALDDMAAGRMAEKGQAIGRAQAIIAELNSVLDIESGGEIADNLRQLYNFMSRTLDEANMQRDAQRIRDVIALLEDLNEAWKVVTA